MLFLAVISLFAPFPLWLIESVLPWPFVFEELFKLMMVKQIKGSNILYPIILGVLFSVSETMMYLINFLQLGNFEQLPLRIVLTTTLHVGTYGIMYGLRKYKYGLYLGLLLGILIHWEFNRVV